MSSVGDAPASRTTSVREGVSPGAPASPDFRILFEGSPSLQLALLPDTPVFTIVAATNAYLAATATERAAILGKGIFEVFPDNPDDPNASGERNLGSSLERVARTARPDSMAVQKYDIRRPDSEGGGFEERFWSPMNSPILDDSGRVRFILHRVEDVTDFVRATQRDAVNAKLAEEALGRARQMEVEVFLRAQEIQTANEALRVANDRLGRLDRMKTEFFSNVSHEFRTPLTLVLGPVETLLADPATSPEARSALEAVHRNALRLLRLVSALLDLSRLEAGRLSARFVPTDLARLTRELAAGFASAFAKAGLRLDVRCDDAIEPVWIDPELWERVVMNLLSNALKFTFEGGVTVTLTNGDAGPLLTVSDTGTGIPASEVDQLFTRFHRVRGARSRSHEGSGIGLALVRELVTLHGGEVAVQSREGVGTEFRVTLRHGRGHLPAPGAAAVAEPSAPGPPSPRAAELVEEASAWLRTEPAETLPRTVASEGRILVVDDNADLREHLVRLLTPRYDVEAVVDGEDALQAVRRQKPDLVLSDVMMPRLDGLGLVRALRADPKTRTVPVVLLSARAGQEASVEGLEAGADDYLSKPFTAVELLARVRTHLSLARARAELVAELQRANEELESFSYSVSHDLRAPLRHAAGFADLLARHAGASLDETGRRYLDTIRQSAERMGRLIDDLLAFSRTARTALRRAPVDMAAVAADARREIVSQAPDRAIDWRIGDLPAVAGDAALLRAVWVNLLSNAVKYSSPRERASIEVGAVARDSELAFFVKDDGVGFDPRYADRLFGVFQRLHKQTEFGGVGIGLANVRRIVERHGGRVWAESEPDRGATFWFALPAEKGAGSWPT